MESSVVLCLRAMILILCSGRCSVNGNVTPEMEKINLGSKGFQFKTCTNSGRIGPTQYQCDRAYEFTDINVTVQLEPPYAGVQVWTVPKTALYSITALGASGGKGLDNTDISRGGYVSGKFNLTEGEEIYMLIGQRGQSACEETNDATKPLCLYGLQSHSKEYSDGGGGGGGGGTFVFKIDPETQEPIPLVIAGGGGGQGLTKAADPINADGGSSNGGDGGGGYIADNGAGGGGGWYGEVVQPQAGVSLLYGGTGGSPCYRAVQQMGWQTDGGFGGGGGGCNSGGGGGGYSGGNVSLSDDPEHSGTGGSSFISPQADSAIFEKGIQEGDGEVEIAYIFDCQCDFLCIYFNEETKRCYCPPNYLLAEDGKTCLNPEKVKKVPQNKMITITTASVLGVLAVSLLILLVVLYRNKCKFKLRRLKHLNNPDYQLSHLRNVNIPRSMEYNPNYDFGGAKCSLQDLREIPRQHLLLIRALGQGAFGEVYQGYLSNLPPEATDMPVAVKTLPALSTEQAEMDFLMEALIMSKFDHPNIVKFVGVCFEKHPRFIILELLEGGDLKNFLRECRPKESQPSPLTMLDLVNLSVDVARGCRYLEENHFIHRDIAARNCLLTTKGPSRIAKIADFGMARDIYRADYYRKGGKAMLPVKWMPPEAFMDGIFTSKTDVWSFGILLWEVFSLGYMPYPGRGNHEVMQLVTAGGRLDPPHNCLPSIYNLMMACWNGISDQRPTFTIVIEKLQEILMDSDLANAPLPVLKSLQSMERSIAEMRSRYPEGMDRSGRCPELNSSNSLDELLRPLEMDYKHPSSVHQGSSQYGVHGKRPEPPSGEGQAPNHSPAGGAIPKSKKPWTPIDAREEESSLLLDERDDVIDIVGLKRTSAEFSDSADSGKSSIDSRKCSSRMLMDAEDDRASASDLGSSRCRDPGSGSCDTSSASDDRPSPGRSASPVPRSKKKTDDDCRARSSPSRLVYENLPPPPPPPQQQQQQQQQQPTDISTYGSDRSSVRDPRYSRRHWIPEQNISSRHPGDVRRWEQGDSGIEVDLRSASKPR